MILCMTEQTRGCEKKTAVTSDPKKPYLISEYNGHMYPTKAFGLGGTPRGTRAAACAGARRGGSGG